MSDLASRLSLIQALGQQSASLGLSLTSNPFNCRQLAWAAWRRGWFVGEAARIVALNSPATGPITLMNGVHRLKLEKAA